ncbi:MAG: BrnT family toxin [Gemmatimonadota bacterium]|nr:BrnT family toxin [Gemmatimonadota bacterium]
MSFKFEWDDNKAASNFTKHRVAFIEAKSIFEDPFHVDFYDPDHSYDEQRYVLVGQSERGRLLIVSYTERGEVVRLIGAREATRRERESYEEGRSQNRR